MVPFAIDCEIDDVGENASKFNRRSGGSPGAVTHIRVGTKPQPPLYPVCGCK